MPSGKDAAATPPATTTEAVAAVTNATVATLPLDVTPEQSASDRSGSAAAALASTPLPSESTPSDDQSDRPREPRHRIIITRGEVKLGPEPLTRTVRVRVAPWRTRVLGDTILPTAPVRVGEREPIAAVRQRALAEQEARLPQTFRTADTRTGVTVELPATESAEALSWSGPEGATLLEARVVAGQAEVSWLTENAPVERVYRLLRRDRTVVVEVRVEPRSHDFTVRTLEGLRAWLRLGVQVLPAEILRTATPSEALPRYAWRAGSGAPRPSAWRDGGTAADPARPEVRIALGNAPGAVALQGCALLDQDTGWALLTDIRQAADRPLGE